MNSLPLPDMCRFDGVFNFAAHFPHKGIIPDLGICTFSPDYLIIWPREYTQVPKLTLHKERYKTTNILAQQFSTWMWLAQSMWCYGQQTWMGSLVSHFGTYSLQMYRSLCAHSFGKKRGFRAKVILFIHKQYAWLPCCLNDSTHCTVSVRTPSNNILDMPCIYRLVVLIK